MTRELQDFNQRGFYVARGLLDQASILALVGSFERTVVDQLQALCLPFESLNLFSLLRALHAADLERYKKVVGALWRKEDAFTLAHDPRIIQFIKQKLMRNDLFLPGGQVVLIMANELRIPDGYFGFVTHQDFPSVQGSLDGIVVWFPLFDVTQNTFPLEVIPGSHMNGLQPMINRGKSTWEVDPKAYDARRFFSVEMAAGDVLFMSVFTIHRSSTKGSSGNFRIALSTRFDNGKEPTFIDRCYPTAFVRSVHREQYVPDFPRADQIKGLFATLRSQ
jgi:ectoine hydroxylase-related dioxygenase (phytanoyl-CoA dioxygenase family)